MMLFVVPDLDGRPTGGTLYNTGLIRALENSGVAVAVTAIDGLRSALRRPRIDFVWIDSLYLDAVPDVPAARGRARLGLILHYLPSLLVSASRESHRLSAVEASALAVCDRVLVTSEFMRSLLVERGVTRRKIGVVEPACDAGSALPGALATPGVRALLVANVVANKGIEPFLRGLDETRFDAAALRVRIVGDLEAEPAYAERCRMLIASPSRLASCVTFAGREAPQRVAAELARANLFVSASRVESYGMALAEARRAGLPIVARAGGNVAAHVTEQSGGRLVSTPRELAAECVRLSENLGELRECARRARASVPPARSWTAASREFLEGVVASELSGSHTHARTNAETMP